ncbi:hypothetical protein [Pseudonocardia nigra]|uniref:hypothetical protein n=1 Tax=Pseudonocardia nigra TaxID=1921578 RepID=UPI001C5FA2FC|nr:hypothetical protein [Pseudonocardia nigra]
MIVGCRGPRNATAVVGLLVALNMLGAALFVHVGAGVFVADGGWELVGVIAVTARRAPAAV